jgi:putative tributyrin esterase
MSVVNINFQSHFLHNNNEVSIILPDKPWEMTPKEFYGNGRKYKVLWLLHGAFGDHTDWLRKSNIEVYACEKDLIVVMPSALNSGYSNWGDYMMGYNMFDYLTEELMPLIYNWFPASDKREDNYIAGLSMGSAGTLKYVVNHPEKFTAAAMLSGVPRNLHNINEETADKRTLGYIRNAGGLEAFINSYENVWDKLAELCDKNVLPRLYFACGTKDFLYDSYLEFKSYAKDIGLKADFEEIEGYGHEWRFWDLTIQHAIKFFEL